MRKGFNYWVGQIFKSIQKNRHPTIKSPNSNSLIQSLQGYTGIYDGKNHSISIITAENCEIEYSKDQTKWGLETPSIYNAGICKVYVKVRNKKQIEYGSAVINIKPRTIILSSASVTKEYDGIPAKDDEVIFSGDGLLGGEFIILHTTGVQQLVGKSINTIEYQFGSNVIETGVPGTRKKL